MCWRGCPFVAAQIWGVPVSQSIGGADACWSGGVIAVTTIRRYQTKYIQDQRSLLRGNYPPSGVTTSSLNFGYKPVGTTEIYQFHQDQPLVLAANAGCV